MHNVTARPNRSAGPRTRPGSTNATAAGANVKKPEQLLPADLREPPQPRQLLLREHLRRHSDLPERGPDPQLRRLPSHIRPIFGEYYADPDTGRRAAGAAAERLHPVYAIRVMIMVYLRATWITGRCTFWWLTRGWLTERQAREWSL